MSDPRDLEATLAEIDRKLGELQGELALLSPPLEEPAEPPPHPIPGPVPPAPAEPIEQAAARVAELGRRVDELITLRKELDCATRSLREKRLRSGDEGPSD